MSLSAFLYVVCYLVGDSNVYWLFCDILQLDSLHNSESMYVNVTVIHFHPFSDIVEFAGQRDFSNTPTILENQGMQPANHMCHFKPCMWYFAGWFFSLWYTLLHVVTIVGLYVDIYTMQVLTSLAFLVDFDSTNNVYIGIHARYVTLHCDIFQVD